MESLCTAFVQRCRDVVAFKIEFGRCIILEFLSGSFVGDLIHAHKMRLQSNESRKYNEYNRV